MDVTTTDQRIGRERHAAVRNTCAREQRTKVARVESDLLAPTTRLRPVLDPPPYPEAGNQTRDRGEGASQSKTLKFVGTPTPQGRDPWPAHETGTGGKVNFPVYGFQGCYNDRYKVVERAL